MQKNNQFIIIRSINSILLYKKYCNNVNIGGIVYSVDMAPNYLSIDGNCHQPSADQVPTTWRPFHPPTSFPPSGRRQTYLTDLPQTRKILLTGYYFILWTSTLISLALRRSNCFCRSIIGANLWSYLTFLLNRIRCRRLMGLSWTMCNTSFYIWLNITVVNMQTEYLEDYRFMYLIYTHLWLYLKDLKYRECSDYHLTKYCY